MSNVFWSSNFPLNPSVFGNSAAFSQALSNAFATTAGETLRHELALVAAGDASGSERVLRLLQASDSSGLVFQQSDLVQFLQMTPPEKLATLVAAKQDVEIGQSRFQSNDVALEQLKDVLNSPVLSSEQEREFIAALMNYQFSEKEARQFLLKSLRELEKSSLSRKQKFEFLMTMAELGPEFLARIPVLIVLGEKVGWDLRKIKSLLQRSSPDQPLDQEQRLYSWEKLKSGLQDMLNNYGKFMDPALVAKTVQIIASQPCHEIFVQAKEVLGRLQGQIIVIGRQLEIVDELADLVEKNSILQSGDWVDRANAEVGPMNGKAAAKKIKAILREAEKVIEEEQKIKKESRQLIERLDLIVKKNSRIFDEILLSSAEQAYQNLPALEAKTSIQQMMTQAQARISEVEKCERQAARILRETREALREHSEAVDATINLELEKMEALGKSLPTQETLTTLLEMKKAALDRVLERRILRQMIEAEIEDLKVFAESLPVLLPLYQRALHTILSNSKTGLDVKLEKIHALRKQAEKDVGRSEPERQSLSYGNPARNPSANGAVVAHLEQLMSFRECLLDPARDLRDGFVPDLSEENLVLFFGDKISFEDKRAVEKIRGIYLSLPEGKKLGFWHQLKRAFHSKEVLFGNWKTLDYQDQRQLRGVVSRNLRIFIQRTNDHFVLTDMEWRGNVDW